MREGSSYFALAGDTPTGFFIHSSSLATGANVTGNQVEVTASKDGIAGAIRDRGGELAGGSRYGVPSRTRIVLINDDLKALAGLRELIEQNSDLAVVAACRCADGTMLAVQKYRPKVVILDIRLLDREGVGLIRDITALSEAKVIVFPAPRQRAKIVSVLRSGANAIVFKDQPASMLICCLREVLAEDLRTARHITTPEQPRTNACGSVQALSAREQEVALSAATGLRNKEIAWELGISEGTVKVHLFRAYRKLHVSNRVGLVRALSKAINKLSLVGLTFINVNLSSV